MNYYKRHLGDYAKDTRHLSLAEHGAFTLLLDYYYATERPIPDDRCERIANAHADADRAAVRTVLREFFVETPEGWRNTKADEVIAESHDKSLKAKESAKTRWGDSKCERNANASNPDSERNASHKPLAKSQKKKEEGVTLYVWIAELEGADAVPAGDPIFTWADKQGIPHDWIGYAWAAFEDRYAAKDKTQANWRAAFRDHVKRGWLDVWRLDTRSGSYVLTTAGEQWKREVSA